MITMPGNGDDFLSRYCTVIIVVYVMTDHYIMDNDSHYDKTPFIFSILLYTYPVSPTSCFLLLYLFPLTLLVSLLFLDYQCYVLISI